MANNRRKDLTAEDCRIEFDSWAKSHADGRSYYKTLGRVNQAFGSRIGVSPFKTEGVQAIMSNEALRNQYSKLLSQELFQNDPEKAELFADTLEHSQYGLMNPTKLSSTESQGSELGHMSSEGIYGAGNVYASSKTVFGHTGILPFVIASYLFTCRSSEIYQIFNGKSNQLDFSYNIDVLQKAGVDYILPFAYRDGDIMGFNQLPLVVLLNTGTADPSPNKTNPLNEDNTKPDWKNPVANALKFTNDSIYCNLFTEYFDGADASSAGYYAYTNTFEGLDPGSLMIRGIVYHDGYTEEGRDDVAFGNGADAAKKGDKTAKVHNVYIRPTQYIGSPNERMFKFSVQLPLKGKNTDTTGVPVYRKLDVIGTINLDSGEISLMKKEHEAVDAEGNTLEIAANPGQDDNGSAGTNIVIGLKLEARIQNIANQMPTATFYTKRQECIREATYRQYASAGINEYMQDNFFIGNDANTNYPAYCTDHILEATMAARELEAEDMLFDKIASTDDESAINPALYPFAPKVGGFVDKAASFNISNFLPGLSVQEYKVQLRDHIMERLSFSDTNLNLNRDLPHEWILLCNNLLANKLIVTKYESQVVNVGADGSNNPFGMDIDTRASFIDNLDRKIRVIANTDRRWYKDIRKDHIFGALKTHTMNMPFFVYYPYSVRMFQAIDANFPNRSAIVVSGMDLRDCWTAGLFQIKVDGAMAQNTTAVNTFANQIADGKAFNNTIVNNPLITQQTP